MTFALIMLLGSVCGEVSKPADPAPCQVLVVDPKLPGIVRLAPHDISDITKGATEYLSDLSKILDVNILAWTVKVDQMDVPPRITEEVIVLTHYRDKKGKELWTLTYLSRRVNSTSAASRRWELDPTAPPFEHAKEYSQEPNDEAIASFIKETNFGNNEFEPAMRKVLLVVSYRQAPVIVKQLEQGLSAKVKEERRSGYFKSIAESF